MLCDACCGSTKVLLQAHLTCLTCLAPCAGAFPLWLAPVQCRLVPVNAAVADYVADVADKLRAAGLRVEVVSGEHQWQKASRLVMQTDAKKRLTERV